MKVSQTEHSVTITPDKRTVLTMKDSYLLLLMDGSHTWLKRDTLDEIEKCIDLNPHYKPNEIHQINRTVETVERGKLVVRNGVIDPGDINPTFWNLEAAHPDDTPAVLIYEEPCSELSVGATGRGVYVCAEVEPEQVKEEPIDPEWRENVRGDLLKIFCDESIPHGYKQIAGRAESYIRELRNRIAELEQGNKPVIQDDFSRPTQTIQWRVIPNPQEGKAYPINHKEEELEAECTRLKNRMQESSAKQEEVIDNLTSDLYEQQGEIERLKAERDRLDKEFNQLHTSYSRIYDAFKSASAQSDNLKAELERLKSGSFEAWMANESLVRALNNTDDLRARETIVQGKLKPKGEYKRVIVTVMED